MYRAESVIWCASSISVDALQYAAAGAEHLDALAPLSRHSGDVDTATETSLSVAYEPLR